MTDIRKKKTTTEKVQDQLNEVEAALGEAGEADTSEEEQTEEVVEQSGWTDEQVNELKDQALRLMADMENLRKRHEREMDETRKYAMTGFARDLLEVLDNLGRATKAVPADERGKNASLDTLLTGVELTERTLLGTFEKHQIKPVVPEKGQKFDHNRHQAMYEVPTDEFAPGCVADVVQTGYVLANRLLRPALVGVAKAAPKAESAKADAGGKGKKGGKVDTTA